MLVPHHVLERAAVPDVGQPQCVELVERRAEEVRVGGGGGVGEEPAEVAVEVRRGGRDERGGSEAEGREGGGLDGVGRRAEEERGRVCVLREAGGGGGARGGRCQRASCGGEEGSEEAAAGSDGLGDEREEDGAGGEREHGFEEEEGEQWRLTVAARRKKMPTRVIGPGRAVARLRCAEGPLIVVA